MASGEKPGERAVFLDRDGTLNVDPGYLNDAGKLELLPTVPEALQKLKKSGFKLVVVSNQSGVGRGLITLDQIRAIHERLDVLLGQHGVKIDHYELCFHHPDENCECRKPKPKLIRDAARKLGVDPARSFMIGDKASDVESGRAAGCRASLLVLTGHGTETVSTLNPPADYEAQTLEAAADWILERS